jgi:hypothetical protein
MFKSSIDEFHAELKLKRDETEITQLELKRGNDQLWAQGKIDNSAEHNYSGAIDATVENINDYLSIFFGKFHGPPISVTFHSDITSNIWEARAVLDPPRSKPVDISGTFPLRIGQPFDQIWKAPVTLSVNIPELHFAEIPRRSDARPNETGILSAQLSIADNLRHPRISGYASLLHAQALAFDINARVRFDDNYGTVELLELGTQPDALTFVGTIDFHDTHPVTIHLFPNQSLYDVANPLLNCFARVELTPINPPSSDPLITGIDLQGTLAQQDWTVRLKEVPAEGLPNVAALAASKTFQVCPPSKTPEPALQIGVQQQPSPTPSPTPTPRRPKKKR